MEDPFAMLSGMCDLDEKITISAPSNSTNASSCSRPLVDPAVDFEEGSEEGWEELGESLGVEDISEDEPKLYAEGVSHAGLPLAFSLEPLANFEPANIVVEPVEPVDSSFAKFGGRCFALRNVLTPQECDYLIQQMSSEAPLEAVRYRQDYRRNDRCVFDSRQLADLLWERVRSTAEGLAIYVDLEDPSKQHLQSREAAGCPEELRLAYGCEGLWTPCGLNECLRFCRYSPGGFFRSHCDGIFRRSEDEMSLFTCMFYLDGGFDGGATRFLHPNAKPGYLAAATEDMVLADVVPSPGLCLLFFQPGLLHEGEELRSGAKHILRTEVMFKRDPTTKRKLSPQEAEARKLFREAISIGDDPAKSARACELYRRAFKLDPRLETVV